MVGALSLKAKLIGIGLLLLALAFAIWRVIVWYDNQLDAAFDRGEKSAYAKVEHRVIEISGKLQASAEKLKGEANAENIVVERHADDLRVRGPGRAACPGAIASSPSGSVTTSGGSEGTGVVGLPDQAGPRLAAVPFDDLVTVLERGQKCFVEASTWRQDYQARSEIIAAEQK